MCVCVCVCVVLCCVVLCGVVWCGVWCGVVWCGVVWCVCVCTCRIEQQRIQLPDNFWAALGQMASLERLCILSKCASFTQATVEQFVAQVKRGESVPDAGNSSGGG